MGWGIRRLVTLFDSLDDLVEEADNHFRDDNDGNEPEDDEFADEETYEKQRE